MLNKKIILVSLGVSIFLNLILSVVIFQNNPVINAANDFETAQKNYPLLSKRVLQEFPNDLLINFLDLRTKLREQVKPYGDSFGFYFEYLPTGTTIGVNEKLEFYAASLFKVPVVMAYYHANEVMGRIHDPELEIKPGDIDRAYGTLWEKGAGFKIKASEAVRLALVESDNTAIKLLMSRISEKDFSSVYQALDVDLQGNEKGALISAKNYSSILKALFFSSVLNKKSSQEILDLLTQTKFNDKLAAGIPHEIAVAHKIGDFADDEGNEGYRDCGIVYVPRRPYILCIFSRSDENTARERMKKLSKTIYDYVSTAN